ncbi:MAG: ABC transporter substrate-binding protein [Bacteriovoracaceae bacterium]|nr:ABC transporter substrate-binding protein [Bacteriovoracaceae bacterium]
MVTVALAPQKIGLVLDPLSTEYTNQFYLLENLTQRLVSLDETGNYKFELAQSITKTNELEFVIKIKNGFFSNGEPITLVDVKKSLDRTISRGSQHVDLKEYVSKTEIKNDALYVYLRKYSKNFLYYLSLPDMGILHPDQYSKDVITCDDFIRVASGPFSYFYDGKDYFLLKNQFYSITQTNYPEKVKLIGSWGYDIMDMTLKGDLTLGQVGLRKYLAKIDQLSEKSKVRIIGTPSDSLTYIIFNEKSSSFKNKEHRRWLRTIIDKNFSVPVKYQDLGRRSKQYFPPESKAFLSEEKVDEVLKQQYLKSKPADFPENVNIYTYTSAYDVTLEPLLKQLELIPDINIKIHDTIDPYKKAEMFKNGEIDIFIQIMSTDVRMPVEAINFEFFSQDAALKDFDGSVRNHFDTYLATKSSDLEIESLQEISKAILRNDQMIPLFHSAIPIAYDSTQVNLEGLSHLFIFNFWKMKTI